MALLLRLNKAAPLTNAEQDNNFLYLDGRCNILDNAKLNITDLMTNLHLVDGHLSGLDADTLDGMQPSSTNVISTVVSRDSLGDFAARRITADQFLGNATSADSAASLSGVVGILHGGTGASVLNAGYLKSNGSVFSTITTIPGADISGNISGSSSSVTGVVSLTNGGTGGNNMQAAQVGLGLIPGQTIQAYSTILESLSGATGSGILTFGNNVVVARQLTVSTGLQISNPDGINGNPQIAITNVAINQGGTGANTAPSARAALGVPASHDAALTGTPTAPTAAFGTKTQQLATCEFVFMHLVPPGTMLRLAGSTVPQGFAATDGSMVSRADNPGLFAQIGTFFGVGNGSSTFNLPTETAGVGFVSVIKLG